MTAPVDSPVGPKASGKSTSASVVRGSTLLILGRLIAKAGNFGTQVLLVRYLTRSDFGGFAYALSLVVVAQTVISLGLQRSIPRFLPIYYERGDKAKVLGTIALTFGTITALGLAIALALYGGLGLAGRLVHDPHTVSLLLILIFLAPLEALDDVLVGIFAVFARPRAIFFRRYVLAPLLKLTTVVLLILSHSNVMFLAAGYVLSSMLGISVYVYLVLGLLRERGLLERGLLRRLDMPWREVFGYTLPLLATDMVPVTINTISVVILGHYWNKSQVADLRAVQPAANLNQMVFIGFSTLFTPAASRLFATRDGAEMNRLYWHTAIWIAVLTFPVFALTCSLAEPITVFFFGAKYRQAAPILAMLSLAYYFNAATGFNGLTLKAFGKVRYMIWISVATVALSVTLSIALIPKFGAIGAGTAMMIAISAYNVFKQAGLKLGTGVRLFDWFYARIYLLIVVFAAALMLIQVTTNAPVYLSVTLAAAMTVVLLGLSARHLELSRTFPEAKRLPWLRFVFAGRWGRAATPES